MEPPKLLSGMTLEDARAFLSTDEYDRLKQRIEAKGLSTTTCTYDAAQDIEREASSE